MEAAIDCELGLRLAREANSLDIETPPSDQKEMWTEHKDSGMTWLSRAGRVYVRKLVYEEKARRFDAKTLWVTKFWLPLLASLVGIIGALTGLIAVLHNK